MAPKTAVEKPTELWELPCSQDQKPSQAVAQQAAEKMDHDTAYDNIAAQVHNISMQGQSCHQAIPLAVFKNLFS